MMISTKLRMVYIDVPKTASFTLDTLFEEDGWELIKHDQGIKHRRVIPNNAKNFTIVASVRNPFDRATSFYFFRKELKQEKESFDDFLDILLSTKKLDASYKKKNLYIFFPICKYLKPIGYDIILRQENLVEDLKQIGYNNVTLETKNKLDRPSWGDMYTKKREEKIIEWAEADFEEFGYYHGS